MVYDLVLLDVTLPKLDGIRVCQRLRDRGYHFPVLMLTARDLSSDKVIGLDAGADAYMVKPFDLQGRCIDSSFAAKRLPNFRSVSETGY